MTSKTIYSKIKTKILIALMILGIICTSLFMFTACNKTTETDTDPNYKYSQTDDGLISNPNFVYGTMDLENTSFPLRSPTGWSRSKDSASSSITSVSSSSARSGVIDVSEDGWKALMNSMYTDSYYLDFLYNQFGFTKDDAINAIKEKNGTTTTPTSQEIKDYIVDYYILGNNTENKEVTNPGVHAGATDKKVYMLNNYTSNIGYGSSQKITSSKAITVKKGEFVQISVWLKTQFITPFAVEYGASIRLTNTFNGTTQGEYVVKNIVADDWTNVTLLVKGDENYDCKVTLALGLGYSSECQTQGTVYFDDVIVEELESSPIGGSSIYAYNQLDYNANDVVAIEYTDSNEYYFYDMTLDESSYLSSTTLSDANVSGYYTKSNNGEEIDKDKFASNADTPYTIANNEVAITLNYSGYTLRIDDANFSVAPEGYTYVSFLVKNQLSKLGSTAITVDVWEKTATKPNKNAALTTISEVSEDWSKVELIIKNNFDSEDASAVSRSFYIEIVVGPTTILSATQKTAFAKGTVVIKDLSIAKGNTYLYNDEQNGLAKEDDTLYKYFTLHEGSADATVSLFAGYGSDHKDTSESTSTSYYFNTSASDYENIGKRPTTNSEYLGVLPTNIRVVNDGEEKTFNNRINGQNGSYAGVVNSAYTYTEFDASLIKNGDKDDQALMIYNKANTEGNYGFIGKSKTISANSFAKISVTLKVDSTAQAFIYLVELDASKGLREVMGFADFNVNTDGVDDIPSSDQTAVLGKEHQMRINVNQETMASAVDGWLTVNFYVATGDTAKTFRLELWNGSRDGAIKSTGYAFFKSASFSLSAGFTESDSFENTFTVSGNPLYDLGESKVNEAETYLYQRPLTTKEKEYNKDYPKDKIDYSAKYVWVKTDTMIYAIFNSIEVADYDPYDSVVDNDTTEKTGCTAKTDPSTFWLQFSTILLVVALVLSIVALFIKNLRRRRKAHASDVKSHYTIKSRVRTNKKKDKVEKEETVEIVEEEIPETEEVQPEEEQKEETLDDYVYGDVQDFGEDKKEETENSSETDEKTE